MISYSFCKNLKNHITEGYQSKFTYHFGSLNLNDKGDESMIDITQITSLIQDVQHYLKYLITNNVPVFLEEYGRHPFWTWSYSSLNRLKNIISFLSIKLRIQNVVHIIRDTILDHLNCFLNPGRILIWEEIFLKS